MKEKKENKVKLVVFDLDGTLVDAYSAITASFNFTMQRLGYPEISPARIRKAVGWGDVNLLRPFVNKNDLSAALLLYRRRHARDLFLYSRMIKGARQALRQLKKKGVRMAVASNRPTRFSMILIRRLKLGGFFDYILCADRVKKGKPDPMILRKIMDKLKTSTGDTLYVGDMAIDARAARRAGVRAVIVTGGSSTQREIKKENPWRIIKDISRLCISCL